MTITETATLAKKKDCGCGGGGGAECCELECLVQPRFFCGQLLADQDLTAIVDWVKTKSALARFRHGWGVVCGLDVHCGTGGNVTVSPGYALDCCGRDIVVCEPKTFDVSGCWPSDDDPCNSTATHKHAAARKAHEAMWADGSIAGTSFGGFTVDTADVQAFDIFIRYSESLSDSRSALARGACAGEAGCEYTRVHEGAELYCKPVEGDRCVVHDDSLQKWKEEYARGLARVWSAVEKRGTGWLDRLTAYVHKNPPSTFCFLREWLCDLRGENPSDETLGQIAYWIVQDWRIAHLAKPCRGCGPDTGVRLGRVWVWRRSDSKRGTHRFTTMYIKNQLPYRRPLAADEWPESSDEIHLGPYIWQPVAETTQALRKRGITVANVLPIDAKNFQRYDEKWITASPTAPVTIYWREDPLCVEEPRVVYFDVVSDVPPGPKHDLMLLEGMTPDIAKALMAANISSLEELAAADKAAVLAALASITAITDARKEKFIGQAQQKLAELGK
jgi:hypothetical protein